MLDCARVCFSCHLLDLFIQLIRRILNPTTRRLLAYKRLFYRSVFQPLTSSFSVLMIVNHCRERDRSYAFVFGSEMLQGSRGKH